MLTVFKNAMIYENGEMKTGDASFDGKNIALMTGAMGGGDSVFKSETVAILPGFCDVHVHFREPGFSYKEDMRSGSAAAARGGYTAVCTMPNLKPTPDSLENLEIQRRAIAEKASIAVYPYGTITVGELGKAFSDMEAIAPYVAAFSDDGKGVQDEGMMREAMVRAKALGKMIAAHCEDNSLLRGGYIHDGAYARAHGHKGICSESEWKQIERDLKLAAETGCAYHVCHISTKESVSLIRDAKKSGVDVTCETGPHYLVLDDTHLQEDGRFKMNPPLRSPEDREALVEGILDGTIEMIATDHAPHSADEKSRGLAKSAMGVVGLETAFPVLYTGLVRPGILTLERLVKLLSDNPRKRFNITSDPGLCVWDLEASYTVDPAEFLSMGRSTPFAGDSVYGKNLMTIYGGNLVWQSK
ncbi:MAG: dihydroorotase [Clostridia bacterium]|nr:dihydroorotase [Clostridia bacterium]MBR6743786.1 dihydroorotase [Clostridia bacterium]